ncbi:MAG: NAD-dependent epimerase/dehydratase family protein [Chloroflexi bacterium]|nr:NAD-dependent epimerase/dehydratase family protein [Chloroflexota bacterium]
MRVLVTGGAGFIGSHLAAALTADGAQVRALDNLSGGKRENLADLPVELIVGDVADMEMVKTAVSGCDLIFHQAAYVSAPRSLEEPDLNHRSNVTGSFNLFEAARQAGVKRVVFASSAAVYGNLPGLPKRENDPLQLLTPYAAAKRMNEIMAENYNAAYGMEIVGLRYMNVFGPRQDPSSSYSGVLSIFCQAAIARRGVTIYGDGEQTRDFVYVADVVQANLRAAATPSAQLPPRPVFNVGRGRQTSLNEIVAMLSEIVGQPIPATYAAERAGDIKRSVADIGLAQDSLGFKPETAVAAGLQATLNWFRAH